MHAYMFTEFPGKEIFPDGLTGAQVLESLALVVYLSAAVCGVLKMFVLKDLSVLFVVTGLLNIAAGNVYNNKKAPFLVFIVTRGLNLRSFNITFDCVHRRI